MTDAAPQDMPQTHETWRQRLGLIPADHYYREDVLTAEIERVFARSWLCVGFVQDLAQPNDFLTFQVGPHSIVVQNCEGVLRAFRNVCSHRFARIQCTRSGNRPLTCPYHGWTYDAAGRPAGIPLNRQNFEFNDADKDALALKAYALETVGHFVFVRMNSEGPDLKTFLGSFYDDLAHVSEACPDRFEHEVLDWSVNWKLGMDNAAEGYHLPMVHSGSFSLILSTDLTLSTDAGHSRYTGKLRDRSRKWWDNVARAIELERGDLYPEYASFLIFPNIIVTFSYGAFLTFQTFEPTGTDSLRLTTTGWLGKNNGRAARDMVAESLRGFTKQVRDEDRDICQVTQAGMRDAPPQRPPLLGAMEDRIAEFQRTYMRLMTPPPPAERDMP